MISFPLLKTVGLATVPDFQTKGDVTSLKPISKLVPQPGLTQLQTYSSILYHGPCFDTSLQYTDQSIVEAALNLTNMENSRVTEVSPVVKLDMFNVATCNH